MSRQPALFLSHGSPMHALQPGAAGLAWAALGRTLPRPRAVLIASAHGETSVPMAGGGRQPDTIHDFGGFPAELYTWRYPTPGAPEVAAQAVAPPKVAGIAAGIDGCRGLDHGARVPLRRRYRDADVPALQVSVQPGLGAAHHLRLGLPRPGARRHSQAPTEEYLLPLFVAWGAAGADAGIELVVDGFESGALAMDSYLFRPHLG